MNFKRYKIHILLFIIYVPFILCFGLFPGKPFYNKSFSVSDPCSIVDERTDRYPCLSALEEQVLDEINLLRKDPAGYATYVKEVRKYYKKEFLSYPGEVMLRTKEGVKAVDECFRELKKTKPLTTLTPKRGLTQAARDHVRDQSMSGKIGHPGSDKSTPFERMDRYGKWNGIAAENIDYRNNIARRIVLSFLIDDGVTGREHRKNLLNEKFNYAGIACGTHPKYDNMCVVDFAGEYTDDKN